MTNGYGHGNDAPKKETAAKPHDQPHPNESNANPSESKDSLDVDTRNDSR